MKRLEVKEEARILNLDEAIKELELEVEFKIVYTAKRLSTAA